MKKRRVVSLTLAMVMVVGLLPGCGFSKKTVDAKQIQEVADTLEKTISQADFGEKTTQEKADLIVGSLHELAKEKKIKESSIVYDVEAKTVSYAYGKGGQGGVVLEDFADVATPEEIAAAEVAPSTASPVVETVIEQTVYEKAEVTDESDKYATEATVPGSTPTDTKVVEASGTQSEVVKEPETAGAGATGGVEEAPVSHEARHMNALVLDAFESDRDGVYQAVEQVLNDNNFSAKVDYEVAIEDLLGLASYDMVSFSMHGTYFRNYVQKGQVQPVLCLLDETENAATTKKYQKLLAVGDVGVATSVSKNGETMSYYVVYPSFFENNYAAGSLANTTVFSESCMFFGWCGNTNCNIEAGSFCNNLRTDFGGAISAAGAPSVVGFHNSVMAVYALQFMLSYMEGIQHQYTPRQVFAACVYQYGPSDAGIRASAGVDGPIAYPVIMGNGLDGAKVEKEEPQQDAPGSDSVDLNDGELIWSTIQICPKHGKIHSWFTASENEGIEMSPEATIMISEGGETDYCSGIPEEASLYNFIKPEYWASNMAAGKYEVDTPIDITDEWIELLSDSFTTLSGVAFKVQYVELRSYSTELVYISVYNRSKAEVQAYWDSIPIPEIEEPLEPDWE